LLNMSAGFSSLIVQTSLVISWQHRQVGTGAVQAPTKQYTA
jgi:hypothetical protein